MLITFSEQLFELADNVVLLGDRGIKQQGSWETIKDELQSVEKFTKSSTSGQKDVAEGVATLDSKLAHARDQAQADLTRKTGDIALYGIYTFQRVERESERWYK